MASPFGVSDFLFCRLGFVSDFVLRISDFDFPRVLEDNTLMSTANANTALSTHQLDLLLGPLERLFTLPCVAARLLEQAHAQPGGGTALLDPALCVRLLMTQGLPAVEEDAIDADRLLEEALSMPALDAGGGTDAFPLTALWEHCVAVGVLTRDVIGAVRREVSPALAFTCGLLHDIGKLALLLCVPKSYQRVLERAAERVELSRLEREVLGADHTTIGRRLAVQWRLPQAVGDTMWLHHQPTDALPASLPHRNLVAAVALADRLARHGAMGQSGNTAAVELDPAELERFDVDLGSLDGLLATAAARVEELTGRLGLHEPASRERHYRALLHAGRSLAERNAALSREQAALRPAARAFSHVETFADSLEPDATIHDVLPRLAHIAADVLAARDPDAPPVVYTVDGPARPLRAVRIQNGQPAWLEVDLLLEADLSVVPVELPVDAEAFDAWLGPGFVHRPLVCAGRWVGGLLAPAGSPALSAAGERLLPWMACTLAMVQGRGQAAELSEQFASASQSQAAVQRAFAEAHTLSAVEEMAAGAAHELNTPLAVLSGRSQLMLRKAATDDERRLWQTMAEQSQKVSDIITELMEFVSPAPPLAEVFDAWDLLRQAADVFRRDPQAAALTVDIEDSPAPVWVRADRRQVLSVLRELLLNAAVAARTPATVRLSAHAGQGDGPVTLTVDDNGPGMPPGVVAKAFTPFFSHQRAGRRRGMGLPRARRVVQTNGGDVELRSTPGRGTTVTLRLPAARRTLVEDVDAPDG